MLSREELAEERRASVERQRKKNAPAIERAMNRPDFPTKFAMKNLRAKRKAEAKRRGIVWLDDDGGGRDGE